MASIAEKIAQIRNAILGKDVREALASGVEAINAEVDQYNSNETNRIDAETDRVESESIRNTNESLRETNEDTRKNNEDGRVSAETGRVNAENGRTSAENARNLYENYDNTHNYVPGNKVYFNGSSYLNISPCTGILPTDTSKWLLISAGGNTPAASAVPINDAGNYFSGTNAEDVLQNVGASLADMTNQKADKDEVFGMINMGQDIREAMTGGSVAVASGDSVGYNNLTKTVAEKLGTYISQTISVTEGYKWDYATKAPVSDPSARYTQIPCVNGDKFRLTTRGNQYMYRYIFLDASNNILASATDTTSTNHYDEEVTAPLGTTLLVLNSTTLINIICKKLICNIEWVQQALVDDTTTLIDYSNSASSNISTTSRRFVKDAIPAGAHIEDVKFYANAASASTVTVEVWEYDAETKNITVVKSVDYTTDGATGTKTIKINYDVQKTAYISFRNNVSCVGYLNEEGEAYYVIDVASTTLAFSSLNAVTNFRLAVTVSYVIKYSALKIAKSLKNGIITVGINGDYNSIQEACNAAPNGSTILVYPGIYREQLFYPGKELYIIGLNKYTCILIDSSSDYRTPPVQANMGSIENMTIIEDALSPATGLESVTYDGHPVKDMAYCIHSDSATGIDGTKDVSFIVRNCIMKNANRPCLGAGTYARQHLILDDVDIYSGVGVVDGYKRGAVYVHNNINNYVLGQNFRMKNCRVHCADENVLYINDTGAAGGQFEAEFLNNMVYSDINGKTDAAVYSLLETSGDRFRLSPKSYGNNVALINM